MRGPLFLFVVLCVATILIGDCSRADEVTYKERLVEICGKVPGLPPIKPVMEDTFDKLVRYHITAGEWVACGIQNADSERDWKLVSKVRHKADEWLLLGLQEINKARREKINNPDPELAAEPERPRHRRPASGS